MDDVKRSAALFETAVANSQNDSLVGEGDPKLDELRSPSKVS